MVLGVLAFGLVLYLPFAGSYGFYDPWETHYAEVARQMARRGDWISLYWPGSPIDGEWFWSKPVFSFWLMAIAFKLTGAATAGGDFLSTSSLPEWAARVPFILMSLLALCGVYLPVARFVSRRAAVLAVVVLATCPLFSLVARQAMTDMAFIGPMTLALGLAALALYDDRDEELPRRRRGRFSWPHHGLFYATAGIFAVLALPQLLVDAVQLRWSIPRGGRFTIPGALVMFPYAFGFGAFLYLASQTRHRAPFYIYIAAMLCGVATLAKGLAGMGLPFIVFVAYLAFTSSWRRLDRAGLVRAILVSLIACAVVVVPWHHAMLARHGFPFWDELYGDNHWRRLVTGRHGDRGLFGYFLREGGYAAWPWLALVPAAVAAAVMRPPGPDAASATRRAIFWFGAIWLVSGYALVSLSVTKFHHYILPALPGLAIVLGCVLDDLLARRDSRVLGVAALCGVPLLALSTYDLAAARKFAQHFIWLFSYDYVNQPGGRPWPDALDFGPRLAGFAAGFAAATLALAVPRLRRLAVPALAAAAIAFTYFLLAGYLREVTPWWTQKHLVATYYKSRRSPAEKLVAWQMYWRGENFYTANEIYDGPPVEKTVFLGDRNAENFKAWMERHRGQRAFIVVEKSRWSALLGLLPAEARPSLRMIDESNMKLCLAEFHL